MTFDEQLQQGMRHLVRQDRVIATLVDRHGTPDLSPHSNYYESLVTSIISQQLSVKAAASIQARFIDSFGHFPTPQEVLASSEESLRTCGLSRQKIAYIHDIARHIQQGSLSFESIESMTNEDIIGMLIAIKGVGEWTAHMFLMFCIGRLNVLPVGDLGIRNAVTKLYSLPTTASPEDVRAIATANMWNPYESLASWYLWASLDNKPSSTTQTRV